MHLYIPTSRSVFWSTTVARGDCRTDPVGAWLPSRQRSDDLPRYPRRTAEPAKGFSEVRTSETTASRETASQERQRRTSWQVRHIAPHRRASCQCSEPFCPWPLGSGYLVGKQGKACLVTLVGRKSRYLLGGKAMSKTAAAVNLHTIHGSAGPMKTPMAFYGSSSRKARTSRIRQRITSNGSTMS